MLVTSALMTRTLAVEEGAFSSAFSDVQQL